MYATLVNVDIPKITVVSLDQAAQHLRLDSDVDDRLVMSYVAVATDYVEKYLDRSLLTKTYKYIVSPGLFPYSVSNAYQAGYGYWNQSINVYAHQRFIELPRGRVQNVTDVTIYDAQNEMHTVTNYTLNWGMEPAQIYFNNGFVGLSACTTQITYTAGYGDKPSDIPVQLRHAVLMMTAFLYENRGDTEGEMPRYIKSLLSNDRLVTFA